MAILGLAINGALATWQEGGRMKAAIKQGKTIPQLIGSTVNFGKYLAIPTTLVALANPATVVGAAAIGLAGFVLPSFIPEIDFTEKKEDQGFSAVG